MIALPADPTFLYDYFTAADGPLNGHAPDTPFGDRVWVASGVNISSNAIVSADQSTPMSFGTATYGTPNVSFGGPLYAKFNALFTTPAVFPVGLASKGIKLTFSSGGQTFTVSLVGYASGNWALVADSTLSGGAVTGPVTLIPNTLYTLSINVGSELGSEQLAAVVNLAGSEVGSASAAMNYLNDQTALNVIGLSFVGIEIGAGFIIDEPNVVGLANSVYSIMQAPAGQLESTTTGHGTAAFTAPSPTLRANCGAVAALTAPSSTLSSTAHSSYGEQAAFLTAPSPLLTITTGVNASASAPSPMLSATGTVTTWGRADLTTPNPVLAASGTVSAMARAYLSAPRPNLVGYGGAVCSITLTGSPTIRAAGTTGGIGGAQITCPLYQLSASATAENHGSASLLAPAAQLSATAQAWLIAPMATLTAIGTATVVATYEAYAVNLNHTPRPGDNTAPIDEMTHYTNFLFTHVVRYQNSYYGANSTGLYLLEGTTDDSMPIPWAVKTAMTDFKNPNLKTLASAYFSGRFGPASNITLSAGERSPVAYSFTTPRGTLAQNHRQSFGRGLKARYYALAASGTGTCEIDAIELDVHNLTRRI
jgi:hypothetical protein